VVNRQGENVSLVVVGAGNIGSHVGRHLARMPEVNRLMLIDKDCYEEKNLRSQDILASDCGKPKAVVQARQVRRIRPDLEVEAVTVPVQEVPLGRLRSTVILACLDTKAARQCVNEAAWHLGIPWIDSGVAADGLLARVNVYVPSTDAPCLECAWDRRDYELLEQSYPCDPSAVTNRPAGRLAGTHPTNAPSSLGALAAALQVIELQKLLACSPDLLPAGWEVTIDALHHKQRVTAYRRNPQCRFDHKVWRLEQLDRPVSALTVGDFVDGAVADRAPSNSASLSAAGRPFVRRLTCPRCGAARDLLRLAGRIPGPLRRCRECGHDMVARGFDLMPRLEHAAVGRALARRKLTSLGFRAGDVVTVEGDRVERHFLL
jgi:molybdopterin/thiamine biosynthesis adenylyltransferase